MGPALLERDLTVGKRNEILFHVNIQTAQSVHDSPCSVEIHAYIVGDVDVVKILDGCLGGFHAVDAGMGQLVPLHSGNTGKGHVIVTGRGGQYDLFGLGIDGGDDVDVAQAVLDLFVSGVDTGKKDVEWLSHFHFLHHQLGMDPVAVDLSGLGIEVLHRVGNQSVVGIIVDDSSHFPLQKGLGHIQQGGIFTDLDVLAQFLADILQHKLRIGLIHAGLNAKEIVRSVIQVLGFAVLSDHDHHIAGIIALSGLLQQIQSLVHVEVGSSHNDADHQAEDRSYAPEAVLHGRNSHRKDQQDRKHAAGCHYIPVRDQLCLPYEKNECSGQDQLKHRECDPQSQQDRICPILIIMIHILTSDQKKFVSKYLL